MVWTCGIEGCEGAFETVESLVVHQATEHERPECKVCGSVVPDGYFAIRHAFAEHSRAEYIRAYNADAAEVTLREGIIDMIDEVADEHEIKNRLTQ